MTSSNLPPVRHLPHWTRVERPRKPGSPRPLPANHLHPLPLLPETRGTGLAAACNGAVTACPPGDTDHRVASMQRNIQFLQQQHRETLEKLHAEIEYLRRENKELQYRLIMEDPESNGKSQPHHRSPSNVYPEDPQSDKRPSQDQALRSKNNHIYSKRKQLQRKETRNISRGAETLSSAGLNHGAELKAGLITSLQPLRIHRGPSHPPRAPTLQECEDVIRQLKNTNSLQSKEIIRIKALLRDIILSRRITPEHYILTKAYLVDGSTQPFEEKKFPKLGLQSFPGKTSDAPLRSGIVLPALKPSLTSTIAERQRRTRVLQRDRFKSIIQ